MLQPKTRPRRKAAVLLIILVLIPVIALGAYSFTHGMRAESRGAVLAGKQGQARWLALSGIEMVRAVLADPQNLDPTHFDLYDNASRFSAQLVVQEDGGMRSFVSIIAPGDDANGSTLRFGLTNECAKIPLHNAALLRSGEALLSLPNMTAELADAIIDWVDANDTAGQNGAESSYYSSLSPPYKPRNGVPLSIGELLLVKGVTPQLLYGEDYNQTGLMDATKNDSDGNWPPDNSDGTLDRGWAQYFTLYSSAANLNPDGAQKISLASADAPETAAKLTELFGEQFVAFYTVYKQQNPTMTAITDLIDKKVTVGAPAGGPTSGGGAIALAASPGGGAQIQLNTGAQTQAGGGGQNQSGGGRGGSGGGGNPNTPPVVLDSPWTSANMSTYLETALEELSLSDKPSIVGLIDVNYAPAPVLRCLPGMTDELANKIASAAKSRAGVDTTPAWLLLEGIVTLEEFRRIEPYVTTASRVFRVEAVGFTEGGGTTARVEAIIDASEAVPKILARRDLPPGGPAYTPEILSGGTVTSNR